MRHDLDRNEQRLNALFDAAYSPTDPPAEPSDALQRRIATLSQNRAAQPAPTHWWRRPFVIGWAPVAVTAALALGVAALRMPTHTPKSTGTSRESRMVVAPPSTGPVWPGASAKPPIHSPNRDRERPITHRTDPTDRSDPSDSTASPRAASQDHSAQSRSEATDDIAFFNAEPIDQIRLWAPRGADWDRIETEVRRNVRVKDDFVQIPLPRIADESGRQIAAAVQSYKREAAIVDARLVRKVRLAFKATALSDLCERVSRDTGIRLDAGQSVADEKVTLFCREMPLREVMRQLSRPFGYAWIRSGTANAYEYELVQDLKSQLVEEELRERDDREALLDLERQMQRYRPYLGLTPDEALARSKTATGAEKKLLEKLAGWAWGPIQMYFRVSSQDLISLRDGNSLSFFQNPKSGERQLPAGLARGIFQSFRDWRVVRTDDGRLIFGPIDIVSSNGVPAADSPEARAGVKLRLNQSELGSLTFGGQSVCRGVEKHEQFWWSQLGDNGATGRSPSVMKPENRLWNKALARDVELRGVIHLTPVSSTTRRGESNAASAGLVQPAWLSSSVPVEQPKAEPKVTSADVLEGLHRATGMPIVADFYTKLYPEAEVQARGMHLFDALNRVSDAMRLRWSRDRGWLQFRSTSFYNDRVKEVPNRLLERWSAVRRQHGYLALDELVEIALLTDAQLNAQEMAEGARGLWGLAEWELVNVGDVREHLRYLAGFTREQRQAAMSDTGLPLVKMPFAQQQRFLALAVPPTSPPLQSLDELSGAVLRVDYSRPGGFQWGDPGNFHSWTAWVVPVEPGEKGRREVRPMLRARTRPEVLAAGQRLDPKLRNGAASSVRQALKTDGEALPPVDLAAQIFPTELRLTFVYIPGAANAREIRISSGGMTNYQASW